MVGRLGKWLRIFGFDTLYAAAGAAERPRIHGGGRLLLTRRCQARLPESLGNTLLLQSDRYTEQLVEVVSALGMDRSEVRLFSRCIRCNSILRTVDKNLVFGQVPDYVWASTETFKQCVRCERFYWAGSHTARVTATVSEIFGTRESDAEIASNCPRSPIEGV